MSKSKQEKFKDVELFSHVFEYPYYDVQQPVNMQGKWHSDFFKNQKPIILELACGKGEYTIGLAQKNLDKNYIGIDLKGNRIWNGATKANEKGLNNVAFIRTQIDFIYNIFGKGEVSEIWIVFPDPYLKNSKARKRLTSPVFLKKYQKIITTDTVIHLKTDDYPLYEYTLEVISELNLKIIQKSYDIDNCQFQLPVELFEIQTFYEKQWREEGRKINYISFVLQPE